VNTEQFRQELKQKEQALLGQLTRAGKRARESGHDPAGDAGDESIVDEQKEEQFRASDGDWATLTQVREALQRIEDGRFGVCLADGEPIEDTRLTAIPWAPYCLQHQKEIEAVAAPGRPTL
jgi:DnaK suppressor protein